MQQNDIVVGENIRALREARAWTQEHLAEAAGCSDKTIARAETGHPIQGDKLMGIAAAFNVDVSTLRTDYKGWFAAQLGVPREELTHERATEFIRQKNKEFQEANLLVDGRLVGVAGDWNVITGVDIMFPSLADELNEEQRDLAAQLLGIIEDLTLAGGDLPAPAIRETQKEMFEFVEGLRRIGAEVVAGSIAHNAVKVGVVLVRVATDESPQSMAIPSNRPASDVVTPPPSSSTVGHGTRQMVGS